MRTLEGYDHIRSLDFSYSNITDADLKHLAGLTRLQWLKLSDTGISDAGLEHLKGLSHLQTLYLAHTRCTPEGVKILQQALPKCRIDSKGIRPGPANGTRAAKST